MEVARSKQQIESSLKVVFDAQNFKQFDVNILGGNDKGDGYIGDIVFAELKTIDHNNTPKNYNLVLKCSKNSEKAREKSPIKEAFYNEIYFYKNVLPEFTKFQKERGIEKPFNNTAEYYGSFTTDNSEMIVLENIKSLGFDMWHRQKPFTRKHLDLVIEAYGKLHGTSAAMQDQDPEHFNRLNEGVQDVFGEFNRLTNFSKLFQDAIECSYQVLQGALDESILKRWLDLKNQIDHILTYSSPTNEEFRVINHGDCWNNNFMFKSINQTVLLDWQLVNYLSPIIDLSFFLYSCISSEDIQDLDTIVKSYYRSFSEHVTKLGSDPNKLYPEETFLNDWKEKSRYGILMASFVFKLSTADTEAAPDIAATVENGGDFTDAFKLELKDDMIVKIRDRSAYLVKYVIENNLL